VVALADARARQNTDQWKTTYAVRAGVEGTMRQTTHVTGIRTARYRGLPKTCPEPSVVARWLHARLPFDLKQRSQQSSIAVPARVRIVPHCRVARVRRSPSVRAVESCVFSVL
jgi:Transposase DDE domain